MRVNDENTKDYIMELEDDNLTLRCDVKELEEEVKSLRLELQLMWKDRNYAA